MGYIKREVDVFQPDVWVFSGSPAFYGDADTSGPGNVIRGELKNIPANERPIFMTMSGIYFSYTINSVVSETGNGSGSFSFIGKNPSGKFMLYTIGKSGILDAREFGIPRDSVITVDLSHRTPPPSTTRRDKFAGRATTTDAREHSAQTIRICGPSIPICGTSPS